MRLRETLKLQHSQIRQESALNRKSVAERLALLEGKGNKLFLAGPMDSCKHDPEDSVEYSEIVGRCVR